MGKGECGFPLYCLLCHWIVIEEGNRTSTGANPWANPSWKSLVAHAEALALFVFDVCHYTLGDAHQLWVSGVREHEEKEGRWNCVWKVFKPALFGPATPNGLIFIVRMDWRWQEDTVWCPFPRAWTVLKRSCLVPFLWIFFLHDDSLCFLQQKHLALSVWINSKHVCQKEIFSRMFTPLFSMQW